MDIEANRSAINYSKKEMRRRVLWVAGGIAFSLTPRPCFGLRRWLLRRFGASIGEQVHIYPSARITLPWNLSVGDWSAIGEAAIVYSLGRITIGRSVTVSQYAHLCAGSHDYRDPAMPLLRLPITIEDEVWICADAFVGPGVTVGQRSILAARGVLVKDAPPGTILGGNPARILKQRD